MLSALPELAGRTTPTGAPAQVVPTAGVPLDDLLAVALLIWFGVQTLRSAATADDRAAEEKEEAQGVVDGFGSGAAALSMVASTFTLVFAAEWGDKSFLATIALAAASSPTGARRRRCHLGQHTLRSPGP
jgi:putative Ca2+/H+ antiporter (TMEM165/GDT1 family)